ncbi:transient receptor potential cation channel subfamily V member 2-like [Phascolarctos cinereus]
MDTVFPETRPETQCQAPGQEEALLDSKVDDLDLQRTNGFTACFFSSIALGDLEAVREQLKEIHQRGLELTHPFLREGTMGKTCLMKALLRSQDKSEQQVLAMVRTLLQHAEEHGELATLLNASYTDKVYRGQTALHIAVERGLQGVVQLLVEKGANLRARATGLFFQLNSTREECFYFELRQCGTCEAPGAGPSQDAGVFSQASTRCLWQPAPTSQMW